MSDYMFMLENHLNAEQGRVLAEVQVCAAESNLSVFLTGGAMRDMLGGFPIRDLDFTVEGPAVKLAKSVAQKAGAEILSIDETRKSVELRFPSGLTAEIGMARQEKYAKPGGKPSVQPATIHEHLRGRDFTVNAIALSLNRASRGLLLDPTNGLADLENRELRAVSNYGLYDDPARLLRLIRLKVRLSYTVAERTQSQYQNVREAALESKITPMALGSELRSIADEPKAGEILAALEQEKLLSLFSPALAGPKLNLPGFVKLAKARELVPFGLDFPTNNLGLFLFVLLEKLTQKERSELFKSSGLEKPDQALWQKLEGQARKLEKELKSPRLQKPSRLYALLSKVPGEQMLLLLVKSTERGVQDRIKNYLQKYLPAAEEVTDRDVTAATNLEPGAPKFEKAKAEMIAHRLDARPKKPEVPEEGEAETPGPVLAASARSARPEPGGDGIRNQSR
jgi:tRNA nucleotidyltransferase (CCA-adding enzyme)